MEYRSLGRSGLKISALSFGAWVTFSDQVGEEVASACMKAAYEAGVNFFDNAEAYARGRAEIMMGDILKKMGWQRSDLIISTKLFWGGRGVNDRGLSRKHISEGTEAALSRLQMDYVDLIYCHRPDLETPIEETVWAMDLVIRRGQAFYWGTSEWTARQISEAWHFARQEHLIPPTMEQPQYNMFTRERVEKEYAPLYRDFGLGTTIWSPLAGGLLTGKYEKGMIPPGTRVSLPGYEWLRERYEGPEAEVRIEKVRRLRAISDELGITPAQLSLAWCLKNPNVSSVITGASRPGQVVENMKAMEAVGLISPEVMERIETILNNKPCPEPNLR
ncbi:MAG: alcohol dehydrogenase [Candidatus Aminicenantes bacterium RBG_19FT_COMBO_58_17]|nr:MAG: alcohol dehydrogenase [Candidatus Aminicenantes bacterium RBG_19FT_COMBO_58_17]